MIERLLNFIGNYPLDFISYLSSSLPIIVGCYLRESLEGSIRVVWYLFLFFFLKDTYALIHMFLIPNILYVQNLEAIIETIIVGAVFFYSVDKAQQKRGVVIGTIICTIITIFSFKSSDISSISLSVFRLFAIILSLSYFNKILTDMRVKNITNYSMFWFVSGLLIYSTGTFFIMLFSEYWYKDINKVSAEIFDKYWNISQLLFIAFCGLSAYGIWLSKYDKENII